MLKKKKEGVRTGQADGLQDRQRTLTRIWPCWPPDFGSLASRTVRKSIFGINVTHSVVFCYDRLSRPKQVLTIRDIALKNGKIPSFLILWFELLIGKFSLNLIITWSCLMSLVQGVSNMSESRAHLWSMFRELWEDSLKVMVKMMPFPCWKYQFDKTNWKRHFFPASIGRLTSKVIIEMIDIVCYFNKNMSEEHCWKRIKEGKIYYSINYFEKTGKMK